MVIKIYATNKRENSLMLPPTLGNIKNVVLKGETSIINPTFILNYDNRNPTQYNYCYCEDFLRYYFIRDWVFDGRMWECVCEVDVLASFRSQIMSSSYYVLRSTSNYNLKIIDTFYLAESKLHMQASNSFDLHFANPMSPNSGRFVLGSMTRGTNIVSPSGITYYVLDSNAVDNIRDELYPNLTSFFQSLDTISDVPALMLSNPTQYIASLMWFPFTPDNDNGGQEFMPVNLGYYNVGNYSGIGVCTKLTHEIPFSATPYRPNSSRGDWCKLEPFCRYSLVLPYFGVIDIPGKYAAYSDIFGEITVSIVTGGATVKVKARDSETLSINTIAIRSAQIGQPFQLTGISENWGGMFSGNADILSGLANMAIGNEIGGGIQAMTGALKTACSLFSKTADSFGSAGGTSETSYAGWMQTEYFDPTEEDITNFGRPLCEQRQLTGLSGFCKVADGYDAKTRATPTEKEKIRNFLEGGFYIE